MGANPRYDLLAEVVAFLRDECAAESEIKGNREIYAPIWRWCRLSAVDD